MTRHPAPVSTRATRPCPANPVGMIMAGPLATVDAGVSVLDAAAELVADEIGAVLVTGVGPTAVLTERDVVTMLGTGGDAATTQVGEVCTTDLVWASPDESIGAVAALMLDAGVRHVPVGDGRRAVGIVSMRDVLAVLVG